MVKIFDLRDFLPFYKVSINNGEEDNDVNNNSNDEEQNNGLEYLNNQTIIGNAGEKAALEYLQKKFGSQMVKHVSPTNSRKGYDIELILDTGKEGYEIKTSGDKASFHITYNELKVALKMLDKYKLFFIKIDWSSRMASGYIICDPITNLGIDFNILTKQTILDNVSVFPDQFIVSFSKQYLLGMQSIDLSDSTSIQELFSKKEMTC